jgi:hypothetical protein
MDEERSEARETRPRRPGARAAALSLFLALLVSVLLLVVPTGTTTSTFCSVRPTTALSGGASGSPTCASRVTHPSLVDDQGWGVAVPLSIPVVVAFVPWALARTRAWRPAVIAAAALMMTFAILGAASVGIFYLPSAVAMVVAASRRTRFSVAA